MYQSRKQKSDIEPVLWQVPFVLSVDVVSKLKAIGEAAAPRVQPGQSQAQWPVLAAFQILLSRYSRQDDLTIGVPATAAGKEASLLAFAHTLIQWRQRLKKDWGSCQEWACSCSSLSIHSFSFHDCQVEDMLKIHHSGRTQTTVQQSPTLQITP